MRMRVSLAPAQLVPRRWRCGGGRWAVVGMSAEAEGPGVPGGARRRVFFGKSLLFLFTEGKWQQEGLLFTAPELWEAAVSGCVWRQDLRSGLLSSFCCTAFCCGLREPP